MLRVREGAAGWRGRSKLGRMEQVWDTEGYGGSSRLGRKPHVRVEAAGKGCCRDREVAG